MRPIPKKLLQTMLDDDYYQFCCIPGCDQMAEKEHAIMYAGRQLNERWAIIPACPDHNRPGRKLNKELNRALAYMRATDADFDKYPKAAAEWRREKKFLIKKYALEEAA